MAVTPPSRDILNQHNAEHYFKNLADQSVLRICIETPNNCENVIIFCPAAPAVQRSICVPTSHQNVVN